VGARARLRSIETHVYRHLRDPRAAQIADTPPVSWRDTDFLGHPYCLLVTFRKTGEPVPTPVWFALGDGEIFIRSGASDGKLKRIRRDPRVLVAPCTFRGRPLGPPVVGEASILTGAKARAAEGALRRRFGLRRRMYRAVRDPTLDVAYLAVRPADEPSGA
jgi:PPOX class probable F420-dependent enzyme